ncbi:primase-helicase zinc-binding domain-containing protein [Neisseria dumasiana]|uniref:primase-helicase zinc-binding domain-containing protein n=1 Tax=Neisseria dumasiana TaxID=1931275 RepID=UPI001FD13B74|nr:primase-helicase zinc-binding domain-containing protein [Neisseria dumasiana]
MNNRRYDLSDLKAAAAGRWPEIHAALGIPREYLNPRKHCPCPYCGGKDRYRYTDYQGTGAFICNQCTPDGGSGFDLLLPPQQKKPPPYWVFQTAKQGNTSPAPRYRLPSLPPNRKTNRPPCLPYGTKRSPSTAKTPPRNICTGAAYLIPLFRRP